MGNELAARRCPQCKLVLAATPENFTASVICREGLDSLCMECAGEVRRSTHHDQGEVYIRNRYAPRVSGIRRSTCFCTR